MSTTTKWVIAIIVIILIIGGVWYYRPQSSSITDTGTGPINIGAIMPLTGEAASYGQPMGEVLKMAVDDINQAGGIKGRPLNLILEDGKCDGKESATVMQKLVNVDKVQVVVGGWCSSESLAAVPIAEQNKVFLISGGSSSPDLTAISKFFARTYPSDATQGKILAETAMAKGWKKVAFIQEQQDYTLGLFKVFSQRFQELGGQTVKEEYAPNSSDFKTQINKLKATKSDALFIDSQAPASSELIAKQLGELKWNTPILLSDPAIGDREMVKRNAKFLEGAIGAEFSVDPTNPKYQAILGSYKAKYGKDVVYPQYAQTLYDAVAIVADGLKAVGNNGEKLAEWIRSQKDWTGASGNLVIGDNGDRVGGHVVKVVKNGEVVLYK